MINSIRTVVVFFSLLPVFCLAQESDPGTIKGMMVMEHKPVEFNYMVAPDGTTELPYFNDLPTEKDYNAAVGKEFISLQSVKNINFFHFSEDETAFLQNSCKNCALYKAIILYSGPSGYTEKQVYLALTHIIWKNTNSTDYTEPRVADLKFVNEISID